MDAAKFSALLGIIIPQVTALIRQHYPYDEVTAVHAFYASKVYAALEDEATGVWHFSPMTLFSMFDEEQKTGDFAFPEET